MSCRHLSVHGCNFESDRRRIVGSSSSIARGALGSYGDRTQGNRANSGGEVVHRLLLGLKCGAPAPAGEQLRTTYTAALAAVVRSEVKAVSASLPTPVIRMMNQVIAETVTQPRFHSSLLGLFAALALLLAAVGLY